MRFRQSIARRVLKANAGAFVAKIGHAPFAVREWRSPAGGDWVMAEAKVGGTEYSQFFRALFGETAADFHAAIERAQKQCPPSK